MGHVDETILKDQERKTAYLTVGGCNFQAITVYLIAIFVFSELVLYAYMSKRKNVFEAAFQIKVENKLLCWLVVLFPLHFTIFTICAVNIKLALARYKLCKILENGKEENETDTAYSVVKISDEMVELEKQSYYLNHLMTELQCIESLCERVPQAVLQLCFMILIGQFKRLELLFDTTFGINLNTILILTWILLVLSIIRSYISYTHRHRYPISPGILGTILQTTSTACLIVPKLVLISTALLNSMFLHPLICMADILVIHIIQRYFLGNHIKVFDSIMMSIAPAYFKQHESTDVNEPEKLSQKVFRGFITLILQLVSLGLYLSSGWLMQSTVFLYNIQVSDEESFVKDIALKKSLITYYWLIIIGIYTGCAVLHCFINYLYYAIGHPWSMAREKKC